MFYIDYKQFIDLIQLLLARYDELTQEKFKNAFILDVRTQEEFSESHYEVAVNIELDAHRGRSTEIPKDRPVIVICRVGMRAYLACRILMGNGYKNVYDLSGGMLTLKAAGLV
ncbi:MAG: rhodanese-like domain-containing protein [Succinivibrio sp.]|nr:rhodanese-like domain-containing protein [Succinivibrio sp.]